jgi:hypothetical protein
MTERPSLFQFLRQVAEAADNLTRGWVIYPSGDPRLNDLEDELVGKRRVTRLQSRLEFRRERPSFRSRPRQTAT